MKLMKEYIQEEECHGKMTRYSQRGNTKEIFKNKKGSDAINGMEEVVSFIRIYRTIFSGKCPNFISV
jgi:hypothetical protein